MNTVYQKIGTAQSAPHRSSF